MECKFVGAIRFVLHQIHKVLGNVVKNGQLAQYRVFIELDKMFKTLGGLFVRVVESELSKFFVHAKIEITNKKVRPELVENHHIRVARAICCEFSVL